MVGPGRRGPLLKPEPASELEAHLVLRELPGIGDRRRAEALRRAGGAKRLLGLSDRRFERVFSREAAVARGEPHRRRRARQLLAVCQSKDIALIPLGAPDYPPELLALVDPPSVLFFRGDRAQLTRRRVAVVGSRRSTASGRRIAERMGRDLSRAGVAVVSGLALGIDGAAHRGALEGSGGTVAVLGSGPDRPQPTAHRALYGRILERGLVVSEFPPGEAARPYHFPRRNRVLAGLASAVVVIEAGERSGALITVDHALDLGIDVFAVPGSVESPQSCGTNALIRDGAQVATSAGDVLSGLGWAPGEDAMPDSGPNSREDPDGEVLYRALGPVPMGLEELTAGVDISTARALAALTRLEIGGLARRTHEGWLRAPR